MDTSIICGGANIVVNDAEYTEYSDETLIEKAKKSDLDAFRVIVQRYESRVKSVAYGIVHNEDDAKDICQDVFIKVYRSLDNFQGNSRFYTWLYRITVNMAIDYNRKIRRKQAMEYIDEINVKTEIPMPETKQVRPDKYIYDKEIYAKLNEAVELLSEEQKKAFVLREMEDLSYQEIADIMKCSVGTVMSRLYYARDKIRIYLKPYL